MQAVIPKRGLRTRITDKEKREECKRQNRLLNRCFLLFLCSVAAERPPLPRDQFEAVKYVLEAWDKFEVAMEVSNNWGGRLDHDSALLRKVSEIVGVPLVVHREIISRSPTGERTTRTTVRGRAHTEQLADVARAKVCLCFASTRVAAHLHEVYSSDGVWLSNAHYYLC